MFIHHHPNMHPKPQNFKSKVMPSDVPMICTVNHIRKIHIQAYKHHNNIIDTPNRLKTTKTA